MIERQKLEQYVVDAASKIMKVDPKSLTMETRWADLKTKSMHAFMINALLEDFTDLKIPMARVLKNETLKDMADLLEELLAAKG